MLHKGQGPTPTPTSVCHESTVILGTPMQTKVPVSKESIVGFETWAVIFMLNTWIWKMELRPKMYFECASFSFTALCKPHNLFGVYNTKFDLRIKKAEYFVYAQMSCK